MIDIFIKVSYRFRKLVGKIYLPGGIKLWVTLLCFSFIGYSIFSNFEKLSQQTISSHAISYLLLGFIVSWISLIVNALAWERIILWLGYDYGDLGIIPLFLKTNILKYLPGGIWHFLERYRSLKYKIGREEAIYSVLLEPLFMIVAALIWVPFRSFNLVLFFICFSPLILFSRPFMGPLVEFLKKFKAADLRRIDSKIFSEQPIENNKIGKLFYPYKAIITEMLFVGLKFAGFLCCLYAFSINQSLPLLSWLSIFALAWIAGLVVPSAPGGVGVFEAVILLLVRESVSDSAVISSLLCYRLIMTFADLWASIFILPRNFFLSARNR